jgi:hypothetical protein
MAAKLEFAPERHPSTYLDWLLVATLSATAGAAEATAFLGLGGHFVAHITGNLVVLAAHYVTGGFSQIGPLLSVPFFVFVLALVTSLFAGEGPRAALRALLILQLQLPFYWADCGSRGTCDLSWKVCLSATLGRTCSESPSFESSGL